MLVLFCLRFCAQPACNPTGTQIKKSKLQPSLLVVVVHAKQRYGNY
jgi:hypothetical protein